MENLTDKDKKNLLKELLRTFAGIADKEYQRRVWIKGEGPECDDFTETVCQLYEEGESVLEDYKSFGITDLQHHLIINFLKEFRYFACENNYPEEFIDTLKWEKFITMAKEILVTFDYPGNFTSPCA